jgi:phosphatidylserine/phosphatidylglycerophosphate/cardiolipin synthase-like enzyme
VICDAGFYNQYPEIPDQLGGLPGAESRRWDVRSAWGGVLHAKCFLIDDEQFFLGSQNWDWRALEHIHEFGVRVEHPGLVADLHRIFALDWALAGNDTSLTPTESPQAPQTNLPPDVMVFAPGDDLLSEPAFLTTPEGKPVRARLAASPPFALPAGIPWDEPLLVAMMDGAKKSLRLQLLSYNPVDREGQYYQVLDNALRRAAARGVQVHLLLAHWAKRSYMVPFIQSLAAVPNLEARFCTIPAWSGGFIPYARVEHAKILIADDETCWVGTANWSQSYFHNSRNISLFLEGQAAASAAGAFFDKGWNSPFAEIVDPCAKYPPPRIGK